MGATKYEAVGVNPRVRGVNEPKHLYLFIGWITFLFFVVFFIFFGFKNNVDQLEDDTCLKSTGTNRFEYVSKGSSR